MLYQDQVKENKPEFLQKVATVSASLGVEPDWLMAVMYNESGLNPKATNSIGAVGLIQWLPMVYSSYGYTKDQMLAMNNVQQMDLVYRFYSRAKGRIKSYTDLHLFTFWPAALGKPDSYVLETTSIPASRVVELNPGFDLNGDRKITVGEYKRRVYDRTVRSLGKEAADKLFRAKTPDWIPLAIMGGLGGIAIFIALAWWQGWFR